MSDDSGKGIEDKARGATPDLVGPYLAKVLDEERWRQPKVELVSGGRSNLTYVVTAEDGAEVILRRPPLGHVLPTAHDMTREFTVISALRDTDVPVPEAIHLCTDEDVIGAPFYVMERLRGHILRSAWPPGYADTPERKRAIGDALVDTLAKIHAVDWAAVGLEEFGHPEGFMARQLRRWTQQWERSTTRELPMMDELIAKLEEKLPTSPDPTIVHGDFRIDNTILDPDQPGRILGVLDWEMSTLGDPLADLGLTLVYWPNEGDVDEYKKAFGQITVTEADGFLSREDVVARYADATGRDVSDVTWYWSFGFFKLAVILEGIHARFLQGKTVGEGFETIGDRVPPLVLVGTYVLDRGEVGSI
ncbi:MAG TPA: phosphotransferase family protein [Actinomycetota bacterium]|nr:phosphotransferase family protein [Actinomycetota bacterium]